MMNALKMAIDSNRKKTENPIKNSQLNTNCLPHQEKQNKATKKEKQTSNQKGKLQVVQKRKLSL